ncbi:MAG: hypothetical protein WCG67_01070, partial [Ferruginibacter sp.]
MKTFTYLLPAFVFTGVLVFGSSLQLVAQCNVNDKYDKIISGYHSSIALKDNGTYAVWGSFMQKTGAADQLVPQDINSTNYTGLTGTVLKAALGGNKGSGNDQGILLTTDGLWAWGGEGNVLLNSLTASAVFARITSPTGATALGLPAGVNPLDVQSLFATYQTLILLTKIAPGVGGGQVWILTQTSGAVEGNNGTAGNAGTSQWKKVMKGTNAADSLTNVVSARGQVADATYNALIAQTTSGAVYTWGNNSYLGNTLVSAARTIATQMTLPQESGSNIIPKMIGVTGGTTNTTKNTYYMLSTTGNIYALGDNTLKQCGDFTIVEKKSWVQVQKSNTPG